MNGINREKKKNTLSGERAKEWAEYRWEKWMEWNKNEMKRKEERDGESWKRDREREGNVRALKRKMSNESKKDLAHKRTYTHWSNNPTKQ